MQILLDTSILIDKMFGSNKQRAYIGNKLDNNDIFITYICLGEFKRTIISTVKIILEAILKGGPIDEEKFDRLIDDRIKNVVLFSGHLGNRIIKVSDFIKKMIDSKSEKYQRLRIPLRHLLHYLVDFFNDSDKIFLEDIHLLEDSYNCPHHSNKLEFLGDRFNCDFTCEKSGCQPKVLEYFRGNYSNEIKLLDKSFTAILNDWNAKDKENFGKSFELLKTNDVEYDGRSHPCWSLLDLFIILETPENFIIFTSNYKHFKPICDVLGKSLMDI
ncbi:MAG: hypothetical protein ACTSWN_01510 [Promethearchaeota archaeon]